MSLLRKIIGRNKYEVTVSPDDKKDLPSTIDLIPRSYIIHARSEVHAIEKVAAKYDKRDIMHYTLKVSEQD